MDWDYKVRKINKKTKIMYVVNLSTMIVYFGAIIFGVVISHELFKFETSSNYKFVLTHIIFGRLSILVMFLHVGMHLDRMFRKIKSKKIIALLYVIYIVIAVFSSIYSIYTLTHSFGWAMVFGM